MYVYCPMYVYIINFFERYILYIFGVSGQVAKRFHPYGQRPWTVPASIPTPTTSDNNRPASG